MHTETTMPKQVEADNSNQSHGIWNFLKYLRAIPFWIIIVCFITLVIGMTVAVFFNAFAKAWNGTILPDGYTLQWFKQAWVSYEIGNYYQITLEIVFSATVISLVLSLPTAYILARRDFPYKNLLIGFFQMPFTLPELVYAIPITSIFYSIGLAETMPGLILVNLIIGIPFSVFILIPFIESLDQRLEWAAQSLGASKFKMLTRIIIPQLIPGITASAINIFIRMFSNFTIILLISGPEKQTLPVMVFSVLSSSGSQPPQMLNSLALSLMFPLLFFAFFSLWFSSYTQRRLGK
ncbi:ABC transporter permease [Paenactinomyces guangxiensis]|uniref:ABC transporter permease subunit n=1 Tax=Paenactinomyces guangxiensis TaxID=1490290 RepID=A0A7W2A865_9BACL|nr:ABC transporter permease subunit [Paenactinomyces guangxiensis]MBA4493488.1 ABC transporter permease subunit [Paenactinomyces guangxiensis]MBH8590579.1 ABC transporter permease subunit [Paenactinomyces guangxiensis]